MMPLIKTRYAIAAVLAMALATIPATLTAQEADAPVVEDAATTPVSDSTSAEERATAQVPDTAVEIEMDRRFNEFRSKYLDDRAEYINRWLAVVAIVLTFFGVVATIAGYIGYKKFRDIESEAHGYIEEIRAHKEQAEKDSQAIEDMLTSQDVADPTKTKQIEQAIDALQSPEASHIDKARADAYSLQQEGKIKEAIEKWRSIANVMEGIDNEVAALAWFSIGYLYQEGKPQVAEMPDSLYKKAINAYNQAIHLDPDYAAAYNNRGVAKDDLKQYEEAIADYDQAIRLDPDYAAAYNNRGNAKRNLEQYKEAIADYDQAVRLDPDDAAAYNNRGNAKNNLEQYEEAIADYNEAIRLDPDNAAVYNNRGNAKRNLEQYEEAIADYNQAIRLDPDYATAYNNRGAAKINLEQYEEAIADYDQAIRLDPDYAVAYYSRAIANIALDHIEAAEADLQTALALAQEAGDEELATAISATLQEINDLETR